MFGAAIGFAVVAPLAGAWIETNAVRSYRKEFYVAPLAGAWIETLELDENEINFKVVAPLAGAWIETWDRLVYRNVAIRRAPRGRVD